ncbi:MAG: hypothetical protein LC677_11845 [Halomonas sp.]|nr:hypothetical protein [Halomonas sp.]
MIQELNSMQAFWLGHLYHASVRGVPLSEYAPQQGLSLAELLLWEKRLNVRGLPVPPRHRPARFVQVAVTP